MGVQNFSGKTRGLGRGIEALIPAGRINETANSRSQSADKSYFMCEVERIIPNKYQPREIFDAKSLGELAKSIKENGIIQPMIVRREGKSFELIAGERRWKAAMLAGFKRVPVVIRNVTDRQTLEMAIIENIQRDDLSCIEEARAYRHLMTDFSMTQEQIAIKVGKDRATVANMIRLLLLPGEIQKDLSEKKLSMGHARALLSLPSEKKQIELRNRITNETLSVRQTERLVNQIKEGREQTARREKTTTDFTYLIDELKKVLETKVSVKGSAKNGKIIIYYTGEDELDRIFNIIM